MVFKTPRIPAEYKLNILFRKHLIAFIQIYSCSAHGVGCGFTSARPFQTTLSHRQLFLVWPKLLHANPRRVKSLLLQIIVSISLRKVEFFQSSKEQAAHRKADEETRGAPLLVR